MEIWKELENWKSCKYETVSKIIKFINEFEIIENQREVWKIKKSLKIRYPKKRQILKNSVNFRNLVKLAGSENFANMKMIWKTRKLKKKWEDRKIRDNFKQFFIERYNISKKLKIWKLRK